MTLYDHPLWQILQDEALHSLPETFSSAEAVAWFGSHYPKFNPRSVQAHLRAMSANDSFKKHHPSLPHDVVLKVGRDSYRRYDPERDGLFDEHGLPPEQDAAFEGDELGDEAEEAFAFSLERHLEEFIEDNWDRIDFGRPLALYTEDDGASGRQYPTSVGYIDFLCSDQKTGDLVVVELKKGRTSDAVVGQCQRYMGWVRENLAGSRGVGGLIIASEPDERLRYALLVARGISMRCFRVNFQLVALEDLADDD